MTSSEPWDVVDAFVAALAGHDAGAAANLCSADAWVTGGDSPARLVHDVTARGLAVTAGDVERDGDRAAGVVEVAHPARPGAVRSVVLLLERGADGWAVEGLGLGALHAAAFLGGVLAARPTPEPAAAAALIGAITPRGRVGRRLRLRLEQLVEAGGRWSVQSARVLPGVARAELVIESVPVEGEPRRDWVYLDLDAGEVLAEDAHASWSSWLGERTPDDDAPEEGLVPPDEVTPEG